MLRWIPGPILAVISAVLFSLNLLFWSSLLFISSIFLIIPIKSWRQRVYKFIHVFPVLWIGCNNCIIHTISKTEWDIQGLDKLTPDDWYLVVSNHRGWIDIFILFLVLHRKIPFPKFFMKKSLLWQLPVASWVCWILKYPFMARYSKSYLKKHPHLKDADIKTTRKVCEHYKLMPTTMLNFLEGHRFTEERHKQQNSPYKYLLKPKAGGIAFTLMTMGDILKKFVDVTLVYPGPYSLWYFLQGKIKKIVVRVEVQDIMPEMLGDYVKDRAFRKQFQSKLNQLWQKKDQLISKIMQHEATE